ncbi:Protocadherin-8 [Pteropus alecto]|uniref:Protocadherin-8 n=1 Tax=Pteropus alecto TaxID=9402 RepID=L5KEB6_PTEAL|nr:Protocadherin-8 [Pteropus alecto]
MSPARRRGIPCLFPLQLFSLCWVLSVAQSKTVRYSTFEEDAPGTVIGTLAEDLHMKVSGDTSFRLMKQFNSSLLRVREGDGQLTVGDAGLDRERLCGQAPQCVLAFDVVSFSQEQFRLVHVEVEVRDQIPVEVSEGPDPRGGVGGRGGRLTLAGPVDYERQDTYELDVRAQDRGPGPRTATCKVIVRIRDVNDNAPDIAITPLAALGAPAASPFAAAAAAAALGGTDATSSTGPGTPEAGAISLVPEGAARESLVALVSTSDRDSGANGQVRCALYGHEHFRLQPAYAGSYLVVTAASLDRERIAEYNLTLVAEDRGAPPLRTVRPYTVRVGDENDNAPLFTRPVYEVSVRENNPPGAYLATVAARDPDLGRNGQVTYRLLEAENDHAPVLVHPAPANGSLEVAVPGRTPRDTAVARVQARDVDEGANGELAFDLLQQEPREAFAIGRRTGEIVLTGDLSQEPPGRVFRALLVISDGGRPPLSTTATVSFVEPAPPVAVWKGHSFNTISGREAEKFSGKDSGKGDSDFNDSDSDISGDALKKDLINHMQSGLWACTAECKILGHSDRCWSPSCGGPNTHPSPHPAAQMSTFCKSTSLPRDPLRRDNYYQAQLPKTVGLQSVYEKVLHRDYDRTVTLLSPPRPGRLPDLQEIGVPLYQSSPGRYLSPKKEANENV